MIGNRDLQTEQLRERAQQAFGLPPMTTEGLAQHMAGLNRDIRIVARTAAPIGLGCMPGG